MDQRAPLQDRQGRAQRLQLREAQRPDAQRRARLRALSAFRHGVLRLSGKVQGKIRRRALRQDSASVGAGVGSPQTWSRARNQSFPGRSDETEGTFTVVAKYRIS